jgi:3-oxoacyl-[acyl-carrier-protein] synthase-3
MSASTSSRYFAPRPRRGVRILGSGAALPAEIVTSLELDRQLGLPAGTVEKKTGVRQRHVETRRSAAALGAEAARAAMAAAGLSFSDLDCLVMASGTPDQAMPCNAALLHHELGLERLPAFDLGASCLGFLVALDTIATLIAAGHHQRVLVVASDIASCGLDWRQLEASGIFGDGAAAFVLGPAEGSASALLAARFETHSQGVHWCEIPGGGSRHHPSRITEPFAPLALFRMDGKAVFRLAAEKLPGFVTGLLADSGKALAEIDLWVPHQASAHALQFVRKKFAIGREKMVDIFAEHGNQVAASLPTALHQAIESGRLRRGEHALLLGTGAGVGLGGAVLCY